jgi:hypothetical protein
VEVTEAVAEDRGYLGGLARAEQTNPCIGRLGSGGIMFCQNRTFNGEPNNQVQDSPGIPEFSDTSIGGRLKRY